MNTESLKTFLLVAELKNLRKASAALFLSQSTISSRIQNLEDEVGQKLFDRTNKTLVLTRAGERMIPYAQNIINMSDTMIEIIQQKDSSKQLLKVGVSNSIYESFLKNYIPHFSMNHPDFSLRFSHKNSALMLADLDQDKIDVCISYLPLIDQSHKCFLLTREQIVLVTGILDTPFVDGITQEELLMLPLYESDYYVATKELADWHHTVFPDNYQFKLHTSVTYDLIYLVQKGSGYAFLPRSYVSHCLEEHSLIEIPLLFQNPPKISSYLVVKNDHYGDSKIQALLSELKENLRILN